MNTYTISSHPEGPEYEVHIVGHDGIRQTMLGDNQRDAVRRDRRMGLRWTDGGSDGWSMAG